MPKPGGTTARGLGHAHRKASAEVMRVATHCGRCGCVPTVGNPLERGHIVPRVLGGQPVANNYQAQCRRCNRGEGGRLGAARRRQRGITVRYSRQW